MTSLVDRLLAAESIRQIEMILWAETADYTLESLVAELQERASRLAAGNRPAEARLVGFLIARVREQQPIIERAAHRRRHVASGKTATDLLGGDDDARLVLEARITDLAERDEVDAALELARQADGLRLRPADYADAAAARHRLADALRGLGRSREALDVLLYTSAKGFPPGDFRESTRGKYAAARFSIMEGLLHEDVGSYELGRFCYETAANAAREAGDHWLEFHALTNAAASHAKAGRNHAALRAFRQILQQAESNADLGQTVATLNNIASLSDPQTATACYERVLEIFARQRVTGTSLSFACFGLGDLAARDGRTEDAVNAYINGYRVSEGGDAQHRRSAWQHLADRLERGGPVTEGLLQHPVTFLALTEAVEAGHKQFIISYGLGEARLKLHRGDREGAVDELRRVLSTPIHERIPGRRDMLRVTFDLAELLALSHTAADRQEAFDLLWRLRQQILAFGDALGRAAAVLTHRRVFERLVRLLAQHGSGLNLPDTRSAPHLAFDVHEEAKSLPMIGSMGRFAPALAGLTQLRERLRGGPPFVSYLCDAEFTTVFVYLPETDRLTIRLVPIGRKPISEAVRRLRRTFNGDPDAFPPLAPLHPRRPWRRDVTFLEEMSALLPFLDDVSGHDLLCIAGDGPLLALPPAALTGPDGLPLALRHAVVHVPNATVLVHNRPDTKVRPQRVLCVGVAARDDPDPALLENDAGMFAATGWHVHQQAGPSAARDNVLGALAGVQVLHLTCHGYLDSRQHLDSGLLLAHAGERPPRRPASLPITVRQEHLLTPQDLAATAIRLSLVTLRACSAGTHTLDADEGTTSLAQAFLLAGVSTVIAPLWDVSEDSSRRMLIHFYETMAADPGAPLWRSFWTAQRKMIQNPDRPWDSHPYHWAALTLFGNWSPM